MTLEAARQEIDMMRVISEVMAELAESERLIDDLPNPAAQP